MFFLEVFYQLKEGEALGFGATEGTKNVSGASVNAGSTHGKNERFRGNQPSSSPLPLGAGDVPPVAAGLLRDGLS